MEQKGQVILYCCQEYLLKKDLTYKRFLIKYKLLIQHHILLITDEIKVENKREEATELVLEQAKQIGENWAVS